MSSGDAGSFSGCPTPAPVISTKPSSARVFAREPVAEHRVRRGSQLRRHRTGRRQNDQQMIRKLTRDGAGEESSCSGVGAEDSPFIVDRGGRSFVKIWIARCASSNPFSAPTTRVGLRFDAAALIASTVDRSATRPFTMRSRARPAPLKRCTATGSTTGARIGRCASDGQSMTAACKPTRSNNTQKGSASWPAIAARGDGRNETPGAKSNAARQNQSGRSTGAVQRCPKANRPRRAEQPPVATPTAPAGRSPERLECSIRGRAPDRKRQRLRRKA